jgi:hypothetical protein
MHFSEKNPGTSYVFKFLRFQFVFELDILSNERSHFDAVKKTGRLYRTMILSLRYCHFCRYNIVSFNVKKHLFGVSIFKSFAVDLMMKHVGR